MTIEKGLELATLELLEYKDHPVKGNDETVKGHQAGVSVGVATLDQREHHLRTIHSLRKI